MHRLLHIAAVVAGSIFLVFVVSYGIVHVFTIRSIQVEGSGVDIEIDRAQLGSNILAVPVKKLRLELLDAYPLLESVWFEKKLPGTLIIHLERRQPYVALKSGGIYYAVAKEGVVIDSLNGSGTYPLLVFDIGPLVIGSTITDGRIRSALTFLQSLSQPGTIARMNEYNTDALQAVIDDTVIYIPLGDDLSAKARTLQIIIDGFRIKGTLPSVIDLRFEKPVITN